MTYLILKFRNLDHCTMYKTLYIFCFLLFKFRDTNLHDKTPKTFAPNGKFSVNSRAPKTSVDPPK